MGMSGEASARHAHPRVVDPSKPAAFRASARGDSAGELRSIGQRGLGLGDRNQGRAGEMAGGPRTPRIVRVCDRRGGLPHPADPQPANDDSTSVEDRKLVIVSLEDFLAIDCEAPLTGTRKVHCACFGPIYESARKSAQKDGCGSEQRVYGLLSAVTQIYFKPRDRAEPFGPLIVIEGKRSVIPDDLRGNQSRVFAQIAPAIRNPGLRARLADIAWLNDRRESASARLAISSYVEAVCLVMDGEAALFFEDEKATSHNAADLLRRACQIAVQTGWKNADTDFVESSSAAAHAVSIRGGRRGTRPRRSGDKTPTFGRNARRRAMPRGRDCVGIAGATPGGSMRNGGGGSRHR